MRERILYYAIKYEGNYDKIHKAILRKERVGSLSYDGQYVIKGDTDYPQRLLELNKPPYVLFYKGDLSLLHKNCVSIVGSRNSCSYARQSTEALIQRMAHTCIVSGMARGIDTSAHKYAIMYRHHTIAVLGSGIDVIYPKSNTDLYYYLVKHHLVISEYPNGVVPKPYFFPFRNRIIAALSDHVYVMQAGLRSGTLLTVNDALELDREIYVLPYRVDDRDGSGCNMLIQQGANMIMSEDLE